MVHYDEIKSQITPLDLLAFQGGDFYSRFLTKVQELHEKRDECSHVGIVINKDLIDLDFMEDDELYIFESTISWEDDVPDMEQNGKGFIGVQVRPLRDVLKSYYTNEHCKVMWAKLENNPFTDSNEYSRRVIRDKFKEFYEANKGKIYEYNPLALLASNFPSMRKLRDGIYYMLNKLNIKTPGRDKDSWKFCSELVADVYKCLGIFPPETDSSNVVPVSFFGDIDNDIPRVVLDPVLIDPLDDEDYYMIEIKEQTKYTNRRALIITNTNGDDIERYDVNNIVKLLMLNGYEENYILKIENNYTGIYRPTGQVVAKAIRWLMSGSEVKDFHDTPILKKTNPDTLYYFHYVGPGKDDDVIYPVDHYIMGSMTYSLFKEQTIDKMLLNSKLTCVFDVNPVGMGCHYKSHINTYLKWDMKGKDSILYKNKNKNQDIDINVAINEVIIIQNLNYVDFIDYYIDNGYKVDYETMVEKMGCEISSNRYIKKKDLFLF